MSSFPSQIQRRQNTQENNKIKTKRREGVYFKFLLCPHTFGSYFYPFVSNAFSSHLLFFKQKEKKTKKKKP
jgi:hypothetical protein